MKSIIDTIKLIKEKLTSLFGGAKQLERLSKREELDAIIERIEHLSNYHEDGLELFVDRIKHFKFLPEHEHSKIELDNIIKSLEKRPKQFDKDIEVCIKYFKQLPKQTESELNDFIKKLKHLPKHNENDLRDLIKSLKYLPKQTKTELKVLVAHLGCLPEHSKSELLALVEHIKYLPERIEEETNSYCSIY